jgi:hypothetical protein
MGRASWAIGRGPWAVGRGPWAVGRGPWAVGRGPWAVGRGSFWPSTHRCAACAPRTHSSTTDLASCSLGPVIDQDVSRQMMIGPPRAVGRGVVYSDGGISARPSLKPTSS